MAYTAFDRFVAWRRFRAALPHVRPRARVCDLGCGLDARFLQYAGKRIGYGVGIDVQVAMTASPRIALIPGDITQELPFHSGGFDHALLLAVLEHLEQPRPLLAEIFRILAPGGSLIITWPAAAIDPLLHILHRVGMVSQEMESHEHKARLPLSDLLQMLAEAGFARCRHQTFEFGLNNLLVCYKARAERKPKSWPLMWKHEGGIERQIAIERQNEFTPEAAENRRRQRRWGDKLRKRNSDLRRQRYFALFNTALPKDAPEQ